MTSWVLLQAGWYLWHLWKYIVLPPKILQNPDTECSVFSTGKQNNISHFLQDVQNNCVNVCRKQDSRLLWGVLQIVTALLSGTAHDCWWASRPVPGAVPHKALAIWSGSDSDHWHVRHYGRYTYWPSLANSKTTNHPWEYHELPFSKSRGKAPQLTLRPCFASFSQVSIMPSAHQKSNWLRCLHKCAAASLCLSAKVAELD